MKALIRSLFGNRSVSIARDGWSEEDKGKHPRGQPGNAGQFGPGGGGAAKPKAKSKAKGEANAHIKQFERHKAREALKTTTPAKAEKKPKAEKAEKRTPAKKEAVKKEPKVKKADLVAQLRGLGHSPNKRATIAALKDIIAKLSNETRSEGEKAGAEPPHAKTAVAGKSKISKLFEEKTHTSPGDLLSYQPRTLRNPRRMAEISEFWNDNISISPKDFAECMFPVDTDEIMMSPDLEQRSILLSSELSGGGKIVRKIKFEEKSVEHIMFELPKKSQGAGIAKKVISNQMETYKNLGLEKVELHANIDVGGYAWLKYGCLPDEKGWNELRETIRKKVSRIKGVSKETKEKVKAIASSNDPRAAWLLSDIQDKSDGGKSVAKMLLMKTGWDGTLALNDPRAMERFNSYVGR